MKRCLLFFILAVFFVVCGIGPARALDAGNEWQPLAIARFGNVELIDAEDGPLAVFLKGIRNDGRFPPPLKTLVGPIIRNPTFYGLIFEAWMEVVILAPVRPGSVRTLWVFPVDSRDEYMTQLANQGLTEYEGMDGVTVLREMDEDGNFSVWHLEWLPGNIAVFGKDSAAVAACRRIYAENSAAHGLLAGHNGEYTRPDAMLSIDPGAITAWQDSEPGRYWWRDVLETLMGDLVQYWQPSPARVRLMGEVTEQFALWPRRFERVTLNVWLEEKGIEWRVRVDGGGGLGTVSQLSTFRSLPDRSALAFAVPVDSEAVDVFGENVARLFVDGAGGVMTTEARRVGSELLSLLKQSQPAQMSVAWVPPPPGRPQLGVTRLLVGEWLSPEYLDAAWTMARELLKPGTVASQSLSRIGWTVEVETSPDVGGTAEVRIFPADSGERRTPYYHASLAMHKNGGRIALAVGGSRDDLSGQDELLRYRAEVAREAAFSTGDGGPFLRQAFVRLPSGGASFMGIMDPVRFVQMALIEMADWRPRSPDQNEPLSAQLAREMLGYGFMGAWTIIGGRERFGWHFSGDVSWQSLSRLAGALGITESIAME